MKSMDWDQKYEAEHSRLIDALGRVTEGGIVEASQHIGATSVPGLSGSPCVDIALQSGRFLWRRVRGPN